MVNRHMLSSICSCKCHSCHSQAVLEEFGKWINASTGATLEKRNAFYQDAYQQVEKVQSPPLLVSAQDSAL